MATRKTTLDTTGENVEPSDKNAVRYWLSEIKAAKKREKDFRKDGNRILNIYNSQDTDKTPFNILFSNTETLLPALYSSIPRPVVQRRFKDDDPLGKEAAVAGQRLLEFLIDTNIEGYETFDEAVRMAALDGLLPGRGVTCLKYDFEIGQMEASETDETADDGTEEEPSEYKKSELVCVETKSWDRVLFGYAKKWSNVPWVGYEEYIDKKEAIRLFGPEMASKLIFRVNEPASGGEKEDKEIEDQEKNQGERKTALVYQIWDKDGGKKIRYISPQYDNGYLKVIDDPLGLTGFFNCPKPLQFIQKSNDLLPTALYLVYENQARELNRLTVRINRIAEAIKARGAYDTELGDAIGSIMESNDNALVPTDKTSVLSAEKGLGNAIWFMPLDVLINVLSQLYIARENCKRVIYEITGISDILRGSSKASETLGAQEIKQAWGTLRLKRLQKEVQRYARDLLRMMLECGATKFSEETWARMTGLPFLLDSQFNELTAISRALEQQVQMASVQAQMASQQGQPVPQHAQPTQAVKELQRVKAQLQRPKWSDVLGMLRDDTQRAYRIDIETNSTIEPEAAEDQKNIAELMNALAQYLNGIGPLVAKGVMPFEAAQSMLLAISRRFRFGVEVEDYIKQMKPPAQEEKGDGGAERAKLQLTQQTEAAKLQLQRETEAAKTQIQLQIESMKAEAEKRSSQARIQGERAIAEMRARIEQETEIQKANIAAATQIEIARVNASAKSSVA